MKNIKLRNFGKFLKKKILSEFVLFIEYFLTIFFKEFFIPFKTITLYYSDMYRDSLFYLNFTVQIQKFTNFIAFKTITIYQSDMYRKIVRKKSEWPKWPFQILSDNVPRKTGINSKWSKMAIPNFFKQFSPKDWYKFKMAKCGHSKFFLTNFSKKRLV